MDGIIAADTKGTVLACNSACEKLFGYGPGEVLGRNVKILMPEPDPGENDNYFTDDLYAEKKKFIGIARDVVGRRKDQTNFALYLSVGEGELNGQRIFVGIMHDLTEQKAADNAVREREARLRSILDTVPDAILTVDDAGLIESFSAAASRLFGYAPHEVIGQNLMMLLPHSQHDRRAGYRIVMGRRRDGSTFPMELAMGEARGINKPIFTAFVRDITERQGTEQHLQELQAELLHVARLTSMGQMSSAIAHELNQPLTAAMNYVKAAGRTLESIPGDDATHARELMGKTAEAIMRAGAIIRNLRDFIEKRENKRAPASLNKVVEEAIALSFVAAASVNVKVKLHLDRTLAPVLIEKIQIQQVLVNLIRNGIEAMQAVENRELTVTTEPGEPGFAQVTVSDTGPGLPHEVQERLFQPFVTTKEKGMGIGLSICQSIIDAHGGSISTVHDISPGATFRFRLPLQYIMETPT